MEPHEYSVGEAVNIDGDKHVIVHIADDSSYPVTVRKVEEAGQLGASGVYSYDEIRGLWEDITEKRVFLTSAGNVVDEEAALFSAGSVDTVACTRVTFVIGHFDE